MVVFTGKAWLEQAHESMVGSTLRMEYMAALPGSCARNGGETQCANQRDLRAKEGFSSGGNFTLHLYVLICI